MSTSWLYVLNIRLPPEKFAVTAMMYLLYLAVPLMAAKCLI